MAFDTCRHLELGFVVVYDRDVLGLSSFIAVCA